MSVNFTYVICPQCYTHVDTDDIIEDLDKMKMFCPHCNCWLGDLVHHKEKVIFT